MVDLFCLGFSWLPVLFFAIWVSVYEDSPVCDIVGFSQCSSLMLALFALTNYAIRVHRHYTFGLVYGDSAEFAKRRRFYVWFPVLLFLALLPFAMSGYLAAPWSRRLYLALVVISVPGGIWNVFHIIMQKYGVLRAYAVKLRYGNAKLERSMLLAWALFLSAALVVKYDRILIMQVRLWKRVDIGFIGPFLPLVHYLVLPAFVPALYYTAVWLRQEHAHYSRASLPKLIYTASIALMLATFGYSLVIGYMIFGFSHSIEYIAFVNIYARRRSTTAGWVRNFWVMNSIWIAGVVGLYAVLKYVPAYREESIALVLGYTTFNSYVHFLYDGFIWKMRDPKVSRVLLPESHLDHS